MLAFTRGLATQFGPMGINVNAIAPAFLHTKFDADFGLKDSVIKQIFEEMAARAPLRRNQTVEDIANAVAFLSSDVSRNITGQCLQVDSGMVMF